MRLFLLQSLALCLLLMFVCTVCRAQATGAPVVSTDAPGPDEHTMYPYTSGSTTYYCFARQAQSIASVVSHTTISNASNAIVTATGHGFHADSSPLVSFSGGTGNWTAINTTFKATIIDTNTFSIPLNTSGIGSPTGTIVLKTQAPRLNQAVWKVLKIVNDASGNTQSKMWATGGYFNSCADRATLSYQ